MRFPALLCDPKRHRASLAAAVQRTLPTQRQGGATKKERWINSRATAAIGRDPSDLERKEWEHENSVDWSQRICRFGDPA